MCVNRCTYMRMCLRVSMDGRAFTHTHTHTHTHTQKFSYCQLPAVVGSVSFNAVYVMNNINHILFFYWFHITVNLLSLSSFFFMSLSENKEYSTTQGHLPVLLTYQMMTIMTRWSPARVTHSWTVSFFDSFVFLECKYYTMSNTII